MRAWGAGLGSQAAVSSSAQIIETYTLGMSTSGWGVCVSFYFFGNQTQGPKWSTVSDTGQIVRKIAAQVMRAFAYLSF